MEEHMKSFNRVILAGNLASDVEAQSLPSGTKIARFRMAVRERRKNKEGEDRGNTVFIGVEAWAKLAETCEKYLKKGWSVLIEGRLKLAEWETEQGEKRSRLLITAEKVEFLDYPEKSEEK